MSYPCASTYKPYEQLRETLQGLLQTYNLYHTHKNFASIIGGPLSEILCWPVATRTGAPGVTVSHYPKDPCAQIVHALALR